MSSPISIHTYVPEYTAAYSEKKSAVDVATDYFKAKVRDVVKIVSYTIGAVSQIKPDIVSDEATRFSLFLGDVKNVMSITEIPEKALKTKDAAVNFFSSPSFETGRAVVKEGSVLTTNTVDGIDLLRRFEIIPISKEAMRSIKTVGFSATILGSANGVAEQAEKIMALKAEDPKQTEKETLYLLNMARDVAYLALGIIGLSFCIAGIAFNPALMLTCLITAWIYGTCSYFYEQTVDPEGKAKDVKQVVANLKNEIEAWKGVAVKLQPSA
jgi:hypothetical protein